MTGQSFEKVVAEKDERIDLARACLLIAQDAYPDLDVDRYLGDIERMALRLRSRLADTGGAAERVVALNEFLFNELGYRGNADEYYDPRNSYVIGIPVRRSITSFR